MKNCLLLILLLLSNSLFSQDYLPTTTLLVENGLPTNIVQAITTDKHNFIWMGTDMGLVRSDGKNFNLYTNALSSNYVKSFYTTSKEHLLVVHDNGVARIHPYIDSVGFSAILDDHPQKNGFSFYYPKSLFEDSNHNLWVSQVHSIVKITPDKIQQYDFEEKYHCSGFKKSFSMVEDQEGNLWASSQQGYLFFFDKEEDNFKRLKEIEKLPPINTITKIKGNEFWVVHEEGVHQVVIEKGKVKSHKKLVSLLNAYAILQINPDEYILSTWYNSLHKLKVSPAGYHLSLYLDLPLKMINGLHLHEEDDIWVATNEGVLLIQPPSFQKVKIPGNRNFIQALNKSRSGNIFITDGDFLLENNQKLYDFIDKGKWKLNEDEIIMSMTQTKESLVIGTAYEIYRLKENRLEKLNFHNNNKVIFYLWADRDDNVWVCRDETSAIYKITPDNQIIEYGSEKGILSSILCIKEDNEGNIFLGGAGKEHYLYQYNQISDSFQNISLPLPFESRAHLSVDDILPYDKGIYLGSNHGLLHYTGTMVEKLSIRHKDDLSIITALALDEQKNLWIGTTLGLYKKDGDIYNFFDESHGLPSKTICYRGITFDNSNNLWVGTISGAAVSVNLKAKRKTKTPVFLELTINKEKIKDAPVKVKNNSFLQASFISLSYPTQKVKYQYRIIGIDNAWSAPAPENNITIPQLTYGNYQLEIRAIQHGFYDWSNPLTYNFSVEKAWYFTWWAFVLFILGFAVSFWVGMRIAIFIFNKEKERTLFIEEKNKALEKAFTEVNKQKQSLETMNVTKDKFFSIIAHDLKAPLNSLSSFANLLINYTDVLTKEEIKSVAEDLNKSVKNTALLTENLLTWARAQMNKLNFSPKELNYKDIIDETISLLTPAAQSKNINISSHIDSDLRIYADEDHIKFIIRNILNNAIKFTFKNGKIAISVMHKNGQVETSVTDTGIGMDEKTMVSLFNPELKQSSKGTSGEKGTGLGLLLCKEFIDMHFGSIKVKSKIDHGSTFIFTLPDLNTIEKINPQLFVKNQ
jgi:signal transduction histidine kinase/ligand-binding sensor domain-containing protein